MYFYIENKGRSFIKGLETGDCIIEDIKGYFKRK